MDTYIIGDEVVLTRNQEGFIRFKGKLPGKTGTFYGIELTQGTGKHSGDYDGTHYFDCAEGRGIFIQKKHIVFKLNEKPNKQPKRKRKKSKATKPSPKTTKPSPKTRDEVGSQFVVKRKAGPNKHDKPKGWKAPEWANDVLEDDGASWESERRANRGKHIDLKNLYDKAGYLPFAQRKKFQAMGYSDTQIDAMVAKWENERIQKGGKKKSGKKKSGASAKKKGSKARRKKKRPSISDDSSSTDDSWDSEEEERRAKAEAKRLRMVEAERKQMERDDERIRKELEKEADALRAERKRLRQKEIDQDLAAKRQHEEMEAERERMRREMERRKMEDDEERARFEEERMALRKGKKRRGSGDGADGVDGADGAAESGDDSDSENESARRGSSGKRMGRNRKTKRRGDDVDGDGDADAASDGDSDGSGRGRSGKRKGRNPKKKKSVGDSDGGDGDGRRRGRSRGDSESGRVRRRGKNPEKKDNEKQYKIYFIVDVRMQKEKDLESKIKDTEALRAPLADIFGAKEEENVFGVAAKIRPGGKAFKFEFGLKIATAMHPADYIQIFDELTKRDDPKIQDALEDALGLDTEPDIHIWEARYEKI